MNKSDMNDGRFQLGDGPGLDGLFTSGEPAYLYMGPIDMSSVLFTESALNRVVNPNYSQPTWGDVTEERNILAAGGTKGGGKKREDKIAVGDRFKHNAKFLNDIYELTKNQIALRSPEQAGNIAPLILTDKPDDLGLAYYDVDKHRIVHPVWDQLNWENSGYYPHKDRNVVVGSRSGQPQFFRDNYVSQMTGERVPILGTAIPHEVAHSIDHSKGGQMSANEKLLWPHVTNDFFYRPRKYAKDIPVAEVFAEYMADALRTDLAEQNPKLHAQYASKNQVMPYEISESPQSMRFTRDTPETRRMMDELALLAESEGLKPFAYYPYDEQNEEREKAQLDSVKFAKERYIDLISGQPDKNYANQSASTKRAKSHLDFLDWFFPFLDK